MSLGLSGIGSVNFTGLSSAGNISVDGVKAGDFLVVYQNQSGQWVLLDSSFNNKVSTDGEIAQLVGGLDTSSFTAVVLRPC